MAARRNTRNIVPPAPIKSSTDSSSSETETDLSITPTKDSTPDCIELVAQPEIKLDFSKPWKMSDLVLSVQGKKLHVHRAILAISSPVFETMLSSNFKEKNAKEIPLPGKKVGEIENLLQAIYPSCKNAITRQNCCSLLELSCEYQMDELKDRCEKFVLDNYRPRTSRSSAVKTLREEALQFVLMSQRHQLSEQVVQRCMATFVSQGSRWESLKTNAFFSQLEPQNSQRIMEERMKFLENRLDTCRCGAKLSCPAVSLPPAIETTTNKKRRIR
ncbi:hypothetical protein ACROYT_G041664 [Oculina patagonica]